MADTGPLFAAVNRRDEHHRRAQAELAGIARSGREVAILASTVLEAYSLILHKVSIVAAQHWLNEIVGGATLIYANADDFASAFGLVHHYRDQQLTAFDAVLYVVSEQRGLPVWTYDHHFDVLRANRWYSDVTF